jgi:iron complex outermembrane receptor protein
MDIVVTARRRAENLQDVPLSITAVSSDQLENQNVRDTIDLSRTAPSVLITEGGGGGNQIYTALRGIGGNEALFGQDQVAGYYIDEVPIARQEGLNLTNFDIEGVQVLYGPQGTLFGRNTVAGAILFNTRRPSYNFEGYVEAEVGNYRQRYLNGALNLPLSDTLAVRVAGQLRRRDGYITEVNSGLDLGNDHNESWRASVRWEPSPDVVNDLIVSGAYSEERVLGGLIFGSRVVGFVPCPDNAATAPSSASLANAACYFGPDAPYARPPFGSPQLATYPSVAEAVALNLALGKKKIALPSIPRNKSEVFSVADILTIDLTDTITLKNVASYRSTDYAARSPSSPMNLPVDLNRQSVDAKQYTEELQFSGRLFDDSLDSTVGAFFFRESGSQTGGTVRRPLTGNELYPLSVADAVNVSKSLYGQATYRPPFLPRLSVTGGIRNTWDTRRITTRSGNYPLSGIADEGPIASCGLLDPARPGAFLPASDCSLSGRATYSVATWLLSADYKITDDVLVYASRSKGYRSGGFNVRALSTLEPFKPEIAYSTEVGAKTSWQIGGVRFRLNGDYWWIDYRDVQTLGVILLPTVPPSPTTTITNSNSLKLEGAEAELTIEPLRGLYLRGFYGYVKGVYDTFVTGLPPVTFNDLPYTAPKHSFGGSVTFNHEVGSIGELNVSASYYKRSGGLNSAIISQTQARGPSSETADLRIGIDKVAGTGLGVAFYAENLLDDLRRIPIGGANATSLTIQENVNEPTYYGLTLKYRF